MSEAGALQYADDMTGKSIVDALLYYKKSNLSDSGSVCWECDVHIPHDCPVDDFDLCVIFGNLLDNALEACQKLPADSNPFITVHAHMVKKCLLIEIANSIPQPENVREAAEKYNGTLQIAARDDIFRVTVLLAPTPCME